MRILIDLPEDDVALLNQISTEEAISRTELVRRTIAASLAPRKAQNRVGGFGLWADCPGERLDFQERMREEWSEHSLTPIS